MKNRKEPSISHHFDIDIAKGVGVNAAIIYNNIMFWVLTNKANKHNMHDGFAWTYNSKSAFAELFPYLSERQIRTALGRLEETGYIMSGNYNKVKYDRTKWYTIPALFALKAASPAIRLKSPMERTKKSNGTDSEVQPVPYINTNRKQAPKKQTNDSPDFNSSSESLFKNVSKRERAKKHIYLSHEDLANGSLNNGGVYTINYTGRLLGRVSTSMESVTDDLTKKLTAARLEEVNCVDRLYDALIVPLKLDSEWQITSKDRSLIADLITYDSLSNETIIEKMLDNIFTMLSGKRVLRFGYIFVGLAELNNFTASA